MYYLIGFVISQITRLRFGCYFCSCLVVFVAVVVVVVVVVVVAAAADTVVIFVVDYDHVFAATTE